MAEYKVKAGSGSKRRRISLSSSNTSGISLPDLPNEALSYAASYLARPSRVMFAVAVGQIRHDRDAMDSDLSNAILLGEQYDILDFGEVEKNLAAKITDDVLQSILLRIDANTRLKKLKLAGCVNITGAGLYPLRGSSVLQQIDLSLVAEHKSPVLEPEPLLACEHVLPILDSIIERDDNTIQRLDFPKSWRPPEGRNTALTDFLRRCNHVFESRNVKCEDCGELVEQSFGDPWFILSEGGLRGIQSFTCFSCMKHFCYNCRDEENGVHHLNYCKICEKEYCVNCYSMEICKVCGTYYCKKCKVIEECIECQEHYCVECESLQKCGGSCNNKVCESCDSQGRCEKCSTFFCDACCENGHWGCGNCGRCENCCRSSDGTTPCPDSP